jgi:hypothetical protein
VQHVCGNRANRVFEVVLHKPVCAGGSCKSGIELNHNSSIIDVNFKQLIRKTRYTDITYIK